MDVITKSMNLGDREVGWIILSQVGGDKFLAMTGARMVVGEKSITFHLPKGIAKNGINVFSIMYNAGEDLYDVEFGCVGRGYKYKTIEKRTGVYASDLIPLFEEVTGLYTSL